MSSPITDAHMLKFKAVEVRVVLLNSNYFRHRATSGRRSRWMITFSDSEMFVLMARYGSSTLIELVFLVGIYHIVRSIVGSFGVLPEPGKPLLGSTDP